MAEPIDYLKTYLNMNPEDYSRMQAQIGGETLPDREIFTMPARAMPMPMPMPAPRQAMEPMSMSAPQNTEVQALMDEIASLKAQIEGTQEPANAPVMADTPTEVNMEDARQMFYQSPEFKDYQERTKNMVQNMAFMPKTYTDPVTGKTVSFQDRSGLFQDWYKKTYGRDLTVDNPYQGSLPSLSDALKRDSFQAPPELTNRMVGEPQKLPQEPQPIPQRSPVASVPAEQIQKSLDMLAKLPKTNIPIIPDMEEIRRKIADANINLPTPVNFQEQLQAIKDLPTMPPVNQISPTMPANPVFPTTPSPLRRTGARNFLETQNRFAPMRFAGGGLSKALSELKTRIS